MPSLKKLAKLRLAAIAREQQIQAILATRRREQLEIMGQSPTKEQQPEIVPVEEVKYVSEVKKEAKVKTKDKLELMMVIWLIFGASAFVAIFGLLLAVLFFASGVITVGGGSPSVLP